MLAAELGERQDSDAAGREAPRPLMHLIEVRVGATRKETLQVLEDLQPAFDGTGRIGGEQR